MKLNYLLSSAIVVLLAVYSCTKISDTEIGTDLIPPIDGVNTKDTIIDVDVKNAGDSVIRVLMSEDHIVGYVEDPLFGTTDARINFQLALPSSNYHFEVTKDSLFLDSVVLVMGYTGIWGDSTKPVNLHVKELDQNQAFIYDTVYKSSENFTASNELTEQISGTQIYPVKLLKDTIHYFQDSGINMMRVRLSSTFGRRLLDYDSTNAYKTDSVFKTYFKGFQVAADPANNALLRVGLTDANTKLALYYHYQRKDTASFDTTVRYFTFSTTASAQSNFIMRDRSSGQIIAYPPNSPGNNDGLIFLQGGPGNHAIINIDSNGLKQLPNVIVHRAELLMDQSPDAVSDQYLIPPYLFLLAKDDTSNFVIPGFKNPTTLVDTRDAVFSGGYLANLYDFGGVPLKVGGAATTSYSFNLSRYIQGIITNKNPQYPLVLYAPYNEAFKQYQNLSLQSSYGYVSTTNLNTAGSGRVRLYGGRDQSNAHRMRLHIVYSIPH